MRRLWIFLKEIEVEQLYEMSRGISFGESPRSRATAAEIVNEFAKRARISPPSFKHLRMLPHFLTDCSALLYWYLSRASINNIRSVVLRVVQEVFL
jgi:hypothetical protein